MENLTVSEIFNSTFHYFSHNESYATPGLYDLNLEDATWALVSPLIFFTMQTGMALIELGVVNKNNRVNVMMKNFADMCVGGMSFWIFGFALMYGRGKLTNPFCGLGDFFVNAPSTDPLAGQIFTLYFLQMSFATKATTIVSGAVAERFRFKSYVFYSFMATFVYSVGGGWIWGQHGVLRNIGVIDFAGSGPIHIIGGASGELKY
jgi:ammonium transporter, Amt family